jgi:hypothetical protein
MCSAAISDSPDPSPIRTYSHLNAPGKARRSFRRTTTTTAAETAGAVIISLLQLVACMDPDCSSSSRPYLVTAVDVHEAVLVKIRPEMTDT